MTWPFPGDSPAARARRAAQAYRTRLLQLCPAACEEIDQQMIRWGQTWIAPAMITHEVDDWLSLAEAAELAEVPRDYLRVWRRRGRITGRYIPGRGWQYQMREILRVIGGRGRGGRKT